ncbi:hypothetical protein AJ80_06040 [Polytolypa hystricis UAMH7299]|uniref:Zn(2)-C6 fungal-type domain-containing protein n=1 Tax=Polytolypa hystricis (strain UAMH7299) TaxID=1447883 RepID=A0A2B7XZG7_POLH7|nr:hypothetical protein AJ80_06040 [Polytolypa hystricis UAMH7299]
MGRKPNAIVSEFFSRGAKLRDSSNRYEHTCKLCGQNFPKGRADSLLSHLTKTCQAISASDKQRVIRLWRITPDGANGKKSSASSRMVRGKTLNLPFAAKQGGFGGLNGLNVLAEASRRVGASDEMDPHDYSAAEVVGGEKSVVVDPALESLEKHNAASTPEARLQAALGGCASPSTAMVNHAESTSPAPAFMNNHSGPPDSIPDARQCSQLSLIAASANEMVTQEGALPLDPDNASDFDHATQRAALYPRPIAINPHPQAVAPPGFMNNFGELNNQPAKHKARSQFSEERRKEVQLVRKMGACLRCRMLKKTCSPGDPCTQCKNIQNPRVWMECCIRTRLTGQLEVYSAGLHTTLAYHDANNIKNQVPFEHSAGRMEMFYFDSHPPKFLTFGVLHGQKHLAPSLDQQLIATNDGEFGVPMQEVHLLDGDAEELATKLEVYMKQMASYFFDSEQSDFVRATVKIAWELSQSTSDDLLDGVLQLWIATRIVVDPTLQWQAYLNPTLPATTMQPLSSTSNESRVPIDQVNHPDSFSLLCSQLRGAAEKRAAKLAKAVLNKVEQRLLQKQREGNFRTFLGSMILLNCVERMTWFFQTWDREEYTDRWPLDHRPSHFAMQGDRLSGIVAMHLKMRALAPACVIDGETHILRAKDSSKEDAVQWFNAINVTANYLADRELARFDPSDSRSLDLKFCCKLFPPLEVATAPPPPTTTTTTTAF